MDGSVLTMEPDMNVFYVPCSKGIDHYEYVDSDNWCHVKLIEKQQTSTHTHTHTHWKYSCLLRGLKPIVRQHLVGGLDLDLNGSLQWRV